MTELARYRLRRKEAYLHSTCSCPQLLSHLRTCCFHQTLFDIWCYILCLSNVSRSLRWEKDFFFPLQLIQLLSKTHISHRVTRKEKINKIGDESPETPLCQVFHPPFSPNFRNLVVHTAYNREQTFRWFVAGDFCLPLPVTILLSGAYKLAEGNK